MATKTWDILNRETGVVHWVLNANEPESWLYTDEAAWCRETGEVVYV